MIRPGFTQETLTIHVVGDTVVEPDERFMVALNSTLKGASIDPAASSAIGTIRDDDNPQRSGTVFIQTDDSRMLSTLRQESAMSPLSGKAIELLSRYRVNGGTSQTSGSDADNPALHLNLDTGRSGAATVASIKLTREVNATACLHINPISGAVQDNTYDPINDQGVELIDSDGNGLVDTLRLHQRDGSTTDNDGSVNGQIQETLMLAEAPRRTVYRFYNKISGVHFYTPDATERDTVIANSYGAGTTYDSLKANPNATSPSASGWGYTFEGVAYQALDTQGTTLYRFYNASKHYHFLTTDANEANTVIRQSLGSGYDLTNGVNKDPLINGWGYTYEGTSYKVSTIAQHGMDHAVYRFFNVQKQVHFYTSSADERDAVIANSYDRGTSYASLSGNAARSEPSGSGWGYRYEGVAWYV